jgi:hypothetical protein
MVDVSRRHAPLITKVRFAKCIDAIAPRGGFSKPGLKVTCRLFRERPNSAIAYALPREAGKNCHDLSESCCRKADVEVAIITGSIAGSTRPSYFYNEQGRACRAIGPAEPANAQFIPMLVHPGSTHAAYN